MSEWQPIETAPKDGTVILAWRFYPIAVYWAPHIDPEYPWEGVQLGGSLPLFRNGFSDGDLSMTHWQPLPKPPK